MEMVSIGFQKHMYVLLNMSVDVAKVPIMIRLGPYRTLFLSFESSEVYKWKNFFETIIFSIDPYRWIEFRSKNQVLLDS